MSMTDYAKKLLWLPWAVTALSALGYLYSTDTYDYVRLWWTPVAVMTGEVVDGPRDGYVLLHMKGRKLRGVECRYVEIQAYGKRFAGPDTDLRMLRTDIPETGGTKSAGNYDIGVWRIWPVDKVLLKSIYVVVTHNCDGTYWSTKIAEVDL